jgi:hypothetical protein
MMVPLQSEFPLRVAVCAWCKPKQRRVDLGVGLGELSHGICLRHLKQLRVEFQMKAKASPPAHTASTYSRRGRKDSDHPELIFQA